MRPMTHCNEHLQIKMFGLLGILCDSLCHTMASRVRFFSFKFYFIFFLCSGGEVARTEGRYERART